MLECTTHLKDSRHVYTTTHHSNAKRSAVLSWHYGHENIPVGPSGHPQYTGSLRRRLWRPKHVDTNTTVETTELEMQTQVATSTSAGLDRQQDTVQTALDHNIWNVAAEPMVEDQG